MQVMAFPAAPAPAASNSSIGYNLAGIGLLVLLAAVGLAYGIDRLSRSSEATPPALTDLDPINQTIAGVELHIPTNWFRYGEQIRDGFTGQIDLRLPFTAEGHVEAETVDVTLLPRSRARTSASLLDAVYLHQFGEETLSGVPGLVGKPMLAGNGYEGESIWYDAISPNPFVAKCAAPIADGSAQCVRTVYLPKGIAAVYTFDQAALQSWRDFDAGMEQWLTVIGAW
jgi:hypothetical protein